MIGAAVIGAAALDRTGRPGRKAGEALYWAGCEAARVAISVLLHGVEGSAVVSAIGVGGGAMAGGGGGAATGGGDGGADGVPSASAGVIATRGAAGPAHPSTRSSSPDQLTRAQLAGVGLRPELPLPRSGPPMPISTAVASADTQVSEPAQCAARLCCTDGRRGMGDPCDRCICLRRSSGEATV